VYPPVDTTFFRPAGTAPEGYLLVVSALVPYKRVDLAIGAAARVGMPLRIIGDGPERARLAAGAGPEVRFLGACTDEEVRAAYQGATAVLLPGVEDFGIVPVEAQACGRPVIALDAGGARETVVEGGTGFLVSDPSPEAFADAIDRLRRGDLDPDAPRRQALRFSRARFLDGLRAEVERLLAPDAHPRIA